MVTKEMAEAGLMARKVSFIPCPDMPGGTACRIGDYWFYLEDRSAEILTPECWVKLKATRREDLAEIVCRSLDMIKDEEWFGAEYAYYEAVLSEALDKKKGGKNMGQINCLTGTGINSINEEYTRLAAEYISRGYEIDIMATSRQAKRSHGNSTCLIMQKADKQIAVGIDRFHGNRNCSIGGIIVYAAEPASEEVLDKFGWSIFNDGVIVTDAQWFYRVSREGCRPYFVTDYGEACHIQAVRIARTWQKGGPYREQIEAVYESGPNARKVKEAAAALLRRERGLDVVPDDIARVCRMGPSWFRPDYEPRFYKVEVENGASGNAYRIYAFGARYETGHSE